jgi:hypothetical protein
MTAKQLIDHLAGNAAAPAASRSRGPSIRSLPTALAATGRTSAMTFFSHE